MFSIKGFSNSDLETAKKFFKTREVLRNAILFEEGRPAQSMFFIDTGSVRLVERKAIDGKDDTLVGIVKAGGYCGEEAVLSDNALHQHTAIALEDCTVFEFTRENLQKIMIDAISTGTKLLLGISKSYREATVTPESTAKLLVFYSPIGGVGTTELAVNCAAHLAAQGKSVAFLDCDLQFGDAVLYLGGVANPNIARLIQIEEFLVLDRLKFYMQTLSNVSFLASPDLPQECEIVSRTHLNQIILELGKKFDYIIADTASYVGEINVLLWDNADLIAMVATPDFSSLTAYHRLKKILRRLNYPPEKISFLLNRQDPADNTLVDDFSKVFPGRMFSVPPSPQVTQNAHVAGKPFVLSYPKDPAAVALDKFLKGLSTTEVKTEEKGGIFSRLKSLFG